ncbi:MAG: SdrD B-like domain-containing protein, partial [Thermoanaerobaculia bacterium]
MHKRIARNLVVCLVAIVAPLIYAQPLVKSAIQVDAGNMKQAGQIFGYRLTYNCSNTSGPCLGAQVIDLLPAGVTFDSTVPASPTGDVAAINVTNNFGGSGRTRVQFVMINPLPAGNSGDLLINVHFPNGSTPNGTVATNTADGINLGTSPGTFTTPPVNVTAVAALQVTLSKTLTTSPAELDLPETYRLRISNVSNANGSLNLTSLGPLTDTLPPGVVFTGSTPAADCQPGCVGTTPASVTWTSPCSLPLTPGNNCDVNVNVTFPSATFPSGTNVTNSFTATGTALGGAPTNLGVGTVTHPVTTFVPNASASLSKNLNGNSPNPPTLNQTFSYEFVPQNNGNVALDNTTVIDTLPIQFQLASVTTGAYNNAADFGAGVGVRVSYEKNTALGVFTLWGSSPNVTTSTTLTAPPPGIGAGEYVTKIKWEYGQTQPGMAPSTRPQITGKIVNPSNAGGPVGFGDSVQNCVALSAVHTAGPTNVSQNACNTFTISGPFVQLNPGKDNLSGGPLNPGQAVSFRLHVRSAAQSSDPAPLEKIVAADLLPVDLIFTGWTFDDQGTGLPAPQNFQQIPNYANTGRTLLRWTWNAGSGNLGVNQQVFINVNTTLRNGAQAGNLSNTMDLAINAPGLAQRCNGSSTTDTLDIDNDGSTADTLCTATGNLTVAPIAQLVSSKKIKGSCDGGAVTTSAGTLTGGAIEYHLTVSNSGTIPMQNFVLIDILPFVGDTGVRDTTPRGSQWTPLLAAPITPPAGTVVYYSTTGNPCRGEVGGPTTACTPPNWTTVAPDPITSVRSFKIDFGSRVVLPSDGIDFTYYMVTPGSVAPGTTAYNSFAYQANRSDGLGSLAAEPLKVGLALGACPAASLGDFVWVDTNHDGIQNDGPTGLNNVRVELWSPGVDGIQNTNDDVRLASTITSNSPASTPGWYRFPGLAPGSYYTKVIPPPTFILTLQGTTTDANDSDGNPATGMTRVITLAANEDNPNLDFGLFTTQKAALGDYVWFDRNSNGLQDESPFDGVNGVTVKLFVDDGNGVPSAGDLQVATTVTADDVYARPGYYLFDGLIPGLPYYVQFVLPSAATGFTSRNTGGDDTIDSDASLADGTTQTMTLAPNEVNRTIDAGLIVPAGTLALGNQVWHDTNNNGIFEPQNGETGIDNVRVDLYRDVNNDGNPTLDEYIGTTLTQTINGFAGRYGFGGLAPGNYIVVINSGNFSGSGALFGLNTSTGNDPAPDPDDDVDGDDNGTNSGALIASHPVTLSTGGEPTTEDGDANTNLTVDFGFTAAPPTILYYDYGDAPDVGSGTGRGNYNTTALDNGPSHVLGVPNAPYLGACVDADSGLLQNPNADADDNGEHTLVVGTCAGGDDENGVTFTGPFTPGATATFNVTAGGGASQCHLDAWVDWNQDGIFGNSAGEQIATNLIVPFGPPTVLTPTVPAGTVPGTTYARFRCSSAGNLGPTGAASDGEVEDYALAVIGYDYGDAPASYGTQGAGAARHVITPGSPLVLGQCVDTDLDGQPNATATGDDATAGTSQIGNCLDDEDGVTFTSTVFACGTASVSVTASGAGKLDAWLDFDRNGTFDATDHIFISQSVVAGVNNLTFAVPCTASPGVSYARFRISTAGNLGPTGDAADGEVEDYAVNLFGLDFGDAPDTYKTTLATDGARHIVIPGFSLGASVDNEPNGQPSIGASGDGADENGVTIPTVLKTCVANTLTINLTNTAGQATPKLDAWIDFDGDGHFDDPRDRVATGVALVSGSNILIVNAPCNAPSTNTYARFRLSSTGIATPTGVASDGEVEDYAVTVAALDYGDAPDPTYPTLLASNGARHRVLPLSNPTLGTFVDVEADGQPNATASGDDNNGVPDDEDGVT